MVHFSGPVFRTLPSERGKASDFIVKLSLAKNQSVGDVVAVLVEFLSRKIVLTCTVKKLN
jgi:hypothetical protein